MLANTPPAHSYCHRVGYACCRILQGARYLSAITNNSDADIPFAITCLLGSLTTLVICSRRRCITTGIITTTSAIPSGIGVDQRIVTAILIQIRSTLDWVSADPCRQRHAVVAFAGQVVAGLGVEEITAVERPGFGWGRWIRPCGVVYRRLAVGVVDDVMERRRRCRGCRASPSRCGSRPTCSCESCRPRRLSGCSRRPRCRRGSGSAGRRCTRRPIRIGKQRLGIGDWRLEIAAPPTTATAGCTWYEEGETTVICTSRKSLVLKDTGFGTKCHREETMIRFQPQPQKGKTGGPGHFGAARLQLWASSPRSYLSALPAHPVELRARRGRCRSALPAEVGVPALRVADSWSKLPPASARAGVALGLAQPRENLP